MDRMPRSVEVAGTPRARRSVSVIMATVWALVLLTAGLACTSSKTAVPDGNGPVVPSAPQASPPLSSEFSGPQETPIIGPNQTRPVITGISPTSGPGGDRVTITGSGFKNVEEVEFGAARARDTRVYSSTQITVTSPPGNGTVQVTVVTSAGASLATVRDQFTYLHAGALGP